MADNTNPQNGTDPQKVLDRAQADLDALHAEAATIHDRRRQVHEQETEARMQAAIELGDVAGATSAALLDLEDLDRRADELPELIWGATLARMYAEARVHRQEQARYDAMEPEARAKLRPAREAFEEAEKHLAQVESHYDAIEKGAERAEERALTLEGEAADFWSCSSSRATTWRRPGAPSRRSPRDRAGTRCSPG